MKKEHCALVLGGYVNGYSIVRELSERGVREIILFDVRRNIASASRLIREFRLIRNTPEGLLEEMLGLGERYKRIVVFPTDDVQIQFLAEIQDRLKGLCFLPFNPGKALKQMDKFNQYRSCKKLGIPFPKTILIRSPDDLGRITDMKYPVLVKPTKMRADHPDIFKNITIESGLELEKQKERLGMLLKDGITLIASEVIPGGGNQVYAYVAYRSGKGRILNEWTGKKLSQFPDDFGIFASASNQAPDIIRVQGRRLMEGMDIRGIAEPEFKYDSRDGKYKLTEINLRSMMWHRIGNLSGVNLQHSQYLDALGKQVPKQRQAKDRRIHYVFMKYELLNLIRRKKYIKTFINNIFNSDETHFAVFNIKDLKPLVLDIILSCQKGISCLLGSRKKSA